MAYTERRERNKGIRYRGMYKAADGRYRSAGTFSSEERALEIAREAMWLDWDMAVTGIASQPFRLWWAAAAGEGRPPSHVPGCHRQPVTFGWHAVTVGYSAPPVPEDRTERECPLTARLTTAAS
jgi:hypothetical protein